MKIRFLILTAALLGVGTSAMADLQLNAGGLYARGEDEESFGFELGAAFYTKHSTSSLASSIGLTYLGISSIEENGEDFDLDSSYSVLGLDYKLYFPLMQDGALSAYVEGLIGAANTTSEAKTDIGHLDVEEWAFTWGLGAGLQYNFTDNFGLSLGYTYLGLDEPNDSGYSLGASSLHLVRLDFCVRF